MSQLPPQLEHRSRPCLVPTQVKTGEMLLQPGTKVNQDSKITLFHLEALEYKARRNP